MKVIDILNEIANGEKVSKFIVCEDTYYLGDNGFLREQGVGETQWYIDRNWLNEEVEIIEEEKKIPEKLYTYCCYTDFIYNDEKKDDKERFLKDLQNTFVDIEEKINEITDYLQSKGE